MNNFTETEFKFCKAFIDKLMAHPLSKEYLRPVDTKQNPDYLSIIQEPMDLGTIKSKLEKRQYKSPDDFRYDVKLVWLNSKTYLHKNKTHLLFQVATKMEAKCKKALKKIPKTPEDEWYLKLEKANRRLQKFLANPHPGSRLVPRSPSLSISDKD